MASAILTKTKTAAAAALADEYAGAVRTKLNNGYGELYFTLTNLRQLREWACVSQDELARFASDACGRNLWPGSIAKLERMAHGARERTARALAAALGVSFADLWRPLSDADRQRLAHQLGQRFIGH